ncbi:hypothetical protein QQP08_021666 [Theobroma cacao]|nr:hypothetical protein QQP08_021666 [Theobroma cacao]
MGSNERVCKFEVAFKSMQQKGSGGVAERVNNGRGEDGGINQRERLNGSDDGTWKRKREEEKAEALIHLICWGPN